MSDNEFIEVKEEYGQWSPLFIDIANNITLIKRSVYVRGKFKNSAHLFTVHEDGKLVKTEYSFDCTYKDDLPPKVYLLNHKQPLVVVLCHHDSDRENNYLITTEALKRLGSNNLRKRIEDCFYNRSNP